MIRKEVVYKDEFEGEEHVEVAYFHLNEPELMAMEVEHKQGLRSWMQETINSNDRKRIMQMFTDLLLASYGVRDGTFFRKSDKIRQDFLDSGVYPRIYKELLSDSKKAAEWLVGLLPEEMQSDAKAGMKDWEAQIAASAQETQPSNS